MYTCVCVRYCPEWLGEIIIDIFDEIHYPVGVDCNQMFDSHTTVTTSSGVHLTIVVMF